jgi:DNA-binding LacI/PurR family transcriptional regulator
VTVQFDIPFAALGAPTLTTATHPVVRIAAGAATAVLQEHPAPASTRHPSVIIRRESA